MDKMNYPLYLSISNYAYVEYTGLTGDNGPDPQPGMLM